MKKIEYYFSIILLLLCLAVGMSSCIKDSNVTDSSDTINLDFQLVGLSRATDSGTDFDNMIKTLRILITDENGTILINNLLNDVNPQNAIRILGVPRTKVCIYAFANEESMGRKFDTQSLLEDLDSNNNGLVEANEILNRAWDANNQNDFFPLTEQEARIKNWGLPMTGYYGVQNNAYYEDPGSLDLSTVAENFKQINIKLVRCVAKVIVNIQNETNSDIGLQSIKFGRFKTNKVYYFRHTDNNGSDMPYDTGLDPYEFTCDKSLLSNSLTNSVLIYYTYPAVTPNNDDRYRFSIALTTANYHQINGTYKEFYKTEESNKTILERNTIMSITGIIQENSFTVASEISAKIEDWTNKGNMEVEFN